MARASRADARLVAMIARVPGRCGPRRPPGPIRCGRVAARPTAPPRLPRRLRGATRVLAGISPAADGREVRADVWRGGVARPAHLWAFGVGSARWRDQARRSSRADGPPRDARGARHRHPHLAAPGPPP